jgi:adenosylmethionine-8-amino-7-oxononanoate aminotransferase
MKKAPHHKQVVDFDRQYVWHPFTQMREWMAREPIVIRSGKGAMLRDSRGRSYLDANASIWTNLHGHRHPAINKALTEQLSRIAHSSALGLASEPASLLAARLAKSANPRQTLSGDRLSKVFFSDDGSTAMEVALKLAYEYTRRTSGRRVPRFLSLSGAYHGDTVGAVSAGHIDLFHKAYRGLLFKTGSVMAPYCYRCPFNRAAPQRADARTYRQCDWECVRMVENTLDNARKKGRPYSAFVVEPLAQGAAGIIAQPEGWLEKVARVVRKSRMLLIADEVMTGFGRTGTRSRSLFASHHEGVQPDLLVLAKGLTGGYLPMAATLCTQRIFNAFLGRYSEFKTFFHGHSYTGNQLGSAAGLASMSLLASKESVRQRKDLAQTLSKSLATLWSCPQVGDIRQIGLIAGIELVRDWRTRAAFPLTDRAGMRVCEEMARRGVLTRPIGNVIVLMPPYCTTTTQIHKMVKVLRESILSALNGRPGVR